MPRAHVQMRHRTRSTGCTSHSAPPTCDFLHAVSTVGREGVGRVCWGHLSPGMPLLVKVSVTGEPSRPEIRRRAATRGIRLQFCESIASRRSCRGAEPGKGAASGV